MMTPAERMELFCKSKQQFILNIRRLKRKFISIFTIYKTDIKPGVIIAYWLNIGTTKTITKLGLVKSKFSHNTGGPAVTMYVVLPIKYDDQVFGAPDYIGFGRIFAIFQDYKK